MTTTAKPTNVREYCEWAASALAVEHDEKVERWYNANATASLNAAQAHPFFTGLSSIFSEADVRYREEHHADLLMGSVPALHLVKKPFASMIDKSLRRNVLENLDYPDPPKNGWFVPKSWFQLNNDIVRSVIACKYIDGPGYIVRHLTARAQTLQMQARAKSQQNDDGYYAYHLWVHVPLELTTFEWAPETAQVSVEIQVTTQLQEVLRALTHRLYEVRRLDPSPDPHSWKWDTASERFQAAYLGHTLHMLEAMILQLRSGKP